MAGPRNQAREYSTAVMHSGVDRVLKTISRAGHLGALHITFCEEDEKEYNIDHRAKTRSVTASAGPPAPNLAEFR